MTIFTRNSLIKTAYILIDTIFMALAIYFACSIRLATLPYENVTFSVLFLDPANPFRIIFLFWIIVTIILNNSHNLYQTRREIVESIEVVDVIKSTVISALIAIVTIYVLNVKDFPRTIVFLVTAFTAISFSLWRVLKRLFVEYLVSQGYNNFNAVIIGAGKVGIALAREIEKKKGLGIRVIGFLDDYKTESPYENGPEILGKISDFQRIARREFVNKVFITIHHDSEVFLRLLETARDMGVAVRVVPQGFDLMQSELCRYNIGFIPILEYCDVNNNRKQFGKRLFDLVIALVMFIFLLPLYVAIAFFIKLDSPGPVFYKSRRFGRRGRIFSMYKFRSMVQNADELMEKYKQDNEVDGPIFKIRNDPRVTKVGRFLRKYSLDELPQVFNVIKGDMSLVGPRPLPINQVEKEDFRQLQRLEVRPGITGLWQIRGRSDISFTRLVKWDVWYINNWSFWLDFNILLQTIPVVFRGRGAY